MKRQRGRGRKPSNQGNRSYESNGPDVKIRGTANQIYEKYLQYARDAQTSGDRINSESYFQHAEHYFRIVAATQPRDRPQSSHDDQRDDDQYSDQMHDGDDEDDDRDGSDSNERETSHSGDRDRDRDRDRENGRSSGRDNSRSNNNRDSSRNSNRDSSRGGERESSRGGDRDSSRGGERESARSNDRDSSRGGDRDSSRSNHRDSSRSVERETPPPVEVSGLQVVDGEGEAPDDIVTTTEADNREAARPRRPRRPRRKPTDDAVVETAPQVDEGDDAGLRAMMARSSKVVVDLDPADAVENAEG